MLEVHGIFAAAQRSEYPVGIGLVPEKNRQFLPYFVTFPFNARSQVENVFSRIIAQQRYELGFDALVQASPADMDDTAAALVVVEEKQGQAVGGLDHGSRSRPLQDQPVACGRRQPIRLVEDVVGMSLL